MNIVAILAGGLGRRVGGDTPKQYLAFEGKTMLEHTISAFDRHPLVDRIIVVVHQDYLETIGEICHQNLYSKWNQVVTGGAERYLSSYAALGACADFEGNILIHDAARPFVSQSLITRLIEALSTARAVVPVTPLSDTLLEVGSDCVISAPPRQNYRLVQTPQAFRLDVLRTAFQFAMMDVNCSVTDDCGVVLKYFPSIPIKTVEGDKDNSKLTYSSDIEYFARLFKKNEGK